ncbi:MAG: hypothetical protein AB7K24_02195 [Gemmataceae bacterium]
MVNVVLTGMLASAALWATPHDKRLAASIVSETPIQARSKGRLLVCLQIIQPGMTIKAAQQLIGEHIERYFVTSGLTADDVHHYARYQLNLIGDSQGIVRSTYGLGPARPLTLQELREFPEVSQASAE